MVIIVGHRGDPTREPENTIRSIVRAFKVGADFVEVDVRLSKDGVPVVIHDETVDRTSNGHGYVREMTLEQLKMLDFGKGEKIPTLEEALEVVKKMKGKVIVEIKEEGFESKIIRILKEKRMINVSMITSFNFETIKRVKELTPKITVGAIFGRKFKGDMLKTLLRLEADFAVPRYTLVTSDIVEIMHQNSLKVAVWTVDNPNDMIKFANMGVDAIVTNNPELAVKTLKTI